MKKFRLLSSKERRERHEKKIILNVLGKKRWPLFSQLKYLPDFLSKQEKAAILIFGGMVIAALIGVSLKLYFDNTKIVPDIGGEYSEGVIDYPRFINPLYSPNNPVDRDLSALIYSGLTAWNTRGNIVLDLAKEYSVSDDEKTYTYVLREDVYWHDGKRFGADDVMFTISAIKDEKYDSPLRASWEGAEIKKINGNTVQFQLKKPYAAFPSLLTMGILPSHIWKNIPVANIAFTEWSRKPIGLGPYKFQSFTQDKMGVMKSYTLVRTPDYYGSKPNIETINFKFYPDYISAVNALDNNQIDGLAFVPAEARNVLKIKNRFDSHDITLPQLNAIFFNAKNNAVLKDKEIRRALALAIDRKTIIGSALDEYAVLIEGPILSDFFEIGGTVAPGRVYFDKEAAQKILSGADWLYKDGNKFRTNKKNEHFKIALTTIDKEQNVKAAQMIKEQWEVIGAEVNLKIVSAGNITKEVIDGRNYEALLFGEMYGPDLDLYQYWHTSALKFPGLNLAQYSNAKTDILLEQARQTSDKLVRQKKYEEFQSLMQEDFPAIFLWQPIYAYFIDKKIKGVAMTHLLTPQDRLKYIIAGYINTKRSLK